MERQNIDKVEVNVSDGGQLNLALDDGQIRSEERRVGKECYS